MSEIKLSKNQIIALIVLVLFGNNAIFGVSTALGRDAWFGLIAAFICSIPMLLMYSRIITLFPEKSFYDIIYSIFGKYIGAGICILYIWYALHLGMLLIKTISEFVSSYSLPEPPYYLFIGIFVLAGIYLAKGGIKTMGKWSVLVSFIIFPIMFILFVFSVKEMDYRNLLPVFTKSPGEFVKGSIQIMAFPILEFAVLLPLLTKIKWSNIKPKKVIVTSVAIVCFILLYIIMRNILVLGEHMTNNTYYPSYVATKTIHVGSFLTRLEESISVYMLVSSIIKLAVCFIAASYGISRVVKLNDEKSMVIPVGLLSMGLFDFVAKNIEDLVTFIEVYPFYSVIFQILIPVFIWVTAELKNKINILIKNNTNANAK